MSTRRYFDGQYYFGNPNYWPTGLYSPTRLSDVSFILVEKMGEATVFARDLCPQAYLLIGDRFIRTELPNAGP